MDYDSLPTKSWKGDPLGNTDANDIIQETETLRRQINLLLKPTINRT